jgi:hypothetical protein
MLPLNFHAGLETYTIQQDSDSVGCACLSLKNSREAFERACLNQHPGARLDIDADFYETCVINLGGDDFDHPVINRRRITTYTHDAMYPPGETDLMEQNVQREPGKDVPGKQGFNEVRWFACEFIETAVPYPGKKCFHIPSL